MSFFIWFIYGASFLGIFTTIFYLLVLYENRENFKNPKPTRYPKVSIIVAAFNEKERIENTIKSLLNLEYPKGKIEYIFVDDESKDNTLEIMKKYESKNFKVFSKKNGGTADARNYGIKRASGEIIVTLDADSYVDSDALMKMIGYFDNPKVIAVTSGMKVHKPKGILQRIQHIEYLMNIFLKKVAAFINCIYVTPGPFSAYRKVFFDKYGVYDVDNVAEDMELAMRMQSHGYIIESAPDACSYTVAPSNFGPLLNQRIRWYKGSMDNMWKYKFMFSKKYGTLGLLYLPSAIISVIFTFAILAYSSQLLFNNVKQFFSNMIAIHFDITKVLNFKIDWFYLSPGLITAISLVCFLFGTVLVFGGRWISNDKGKFVASYILVLFLYMPLYAVWWLSAIFYKTTGKKIKWAGVVWKKD